MNELTELFEAMEIHSFELGSYYWVDITHINNPLDFYVRPTAYRKYMSMLQVYEDAIKPSELTLDKLVIFKSKQLRKCVRGCIRAINDENMCCDIYAIDIGLIERAVPLRRLRKLCNDITVPSLATHCELAYCLPKGGSFSKDAIDAMKLYVGNERAKLLVRGHSHDKLKVDLINSCPDDIGTMLALTDYTIINYPFHMQATHHAATGTDYKHREFKVDDVLDVRCQSGETLEAFYVAIEHDHKNYIRQRWEFTEYCRDRNAMGAHEIKTGVAVGVYVARSGFYERGTIKEVTEHKSKVLVQLVDWGTEVEVEVTKLKAIKVGKYYVNPVCAIYCKANEQQQGDSNIQRVLYPGFKFQIEIKALGNEFTSPNLVHIQVPLTGN